MIRVFIIESGALPDLGNEYKLQRTFSEFECRISASGTFSASGWGRPNLSCIEFERRISASGTFSASGWGQTEFKLQRIRTPNFGVRHIFGVRLGADRI